MIVVEICHLYVSPGHNFFGHHEREPDQYPTIEVSMIEFVAGHGVRGDRFFDYKKDYKGQITFFSLEAFDELCDALQVQDCSRALVRRNVITQDVDLNQLIGQEFEIQGVRFHRNRRMSAVLLDESRDRARRGRISQGSGRLAPADFDGW